MVLFGRFYHINTSLICFVVHYIKFYIEVVPSHYRLPYFIRKLSIIFCQTFNLVHLKLVRHSTENHPSFKRIKCIKKQYYVLSLRDLNNEYSLRWILFVLRIHVFHNAIGCFILFLIWSILSMFCYKLCKYPHYKNISSRIYSYLELFNEVKM